MLDILRRSGALVVFGSGVFLLSLNNQATSEDWLKCLNEQQIAAIEYYNDKLSCFKTESHEKNLDCIKIDKRVCDDLKFIEEICGYRPRRIKAFGKFYNTDDMKLFAKCN